MAQPAVIPVKTGQKVPSVFGQWKAVITTIKNHDLNLVKGIIVILYLF